MPRPRKIDRIDLSAVASAREAGVPVKAIARALGCSRWTLQRAMGGGHGVLHHNSRVLHHPDGCRDVEPQGTNCAIAPSCPPDRS